MTKNKLTTMAMGSILTALGFLSTPSSVLAVCPVCTIAVAGGLGISKALGIDDLVTSVWIGGLILSVSFWTIDWVNKKGFFKKVNPKTLTTTIVLLWYALTLTPLYFENLIGLPYNTILGIDKILFGTTVGSTVFLLGVWLDRKQRVKYGKQFFSYQKVVFPVVLLILASLLMFVLTKYRLAI
jgi:hypothetical protein